MSDFPSSTKPMRLLGHLRKPTPRFHQHGGVSRRWRGSRPRASRCSSIAISPRLPPFNPDDDVEDRPKPEPVETLRTLVGASDAIVIAAPEYAHGVPGALKNALDWLVASETFAGKPVVLINASPRAFHAQASLREILATMAARLVPEAFAALSLSGKSLTADVLADPVNARRLKEALEALLEMLSQADRLGTSPP